MTKEYTVNTFVMDSGERHCLVIDRETGLPEYYPNLFLTTQFRNKSVATATLESAACNIALLLSYLDSRKIHLEKRFLAKEFFKVHELDDLRDYAQYRFRSLATDSNDKSIVKLVEQGNFKAFVKNGTQYARLTTFASYLKWFAQHLLGVTNQEVIERIYNMDQQIKERRPFKKGRSDDQQDKSLSEDQLNALFEIVRLDSPLNPFTQSVRRRNRLMILVLYYLGIRSGELLNIRIRDINFNNNQLRIIRRADDLSDSRVRQPNAKTRERVLPLSDVLAKELHKYIVSERRNIKNAGKNDYLFVTHKSCPGIGKPLSKSSFQKVILVVKSVSPDLYAITGHALRHTWNRKFSEKMDSMDLPPSEEQQEKIRSYLMGWEEDSGTAATYNKRHIQKKAWEAALFLQETNGTRTPNTGGS